MTLNLLIVFSLLIVDTLTPTLVLITTLLMLHGGSGGISGDCQRMAQLRLEPPEPFNVRAPNDWPCWKRRFEHFRIASGLQGRSQIQQVSTLLYCLGEEAEGVLTSTNVTADERKVYDTVFEKIDTSRFDGT